MPPNALARTPKYYFILYDITDQVTGLFLNRTEMEVEAERVGLEVVPVLAKGNSGSSFDEATKLIALIEAGELKSYLGGKPEGVVLKYQNAPDAQNRSYKLVSKEYQESKSLDSLRTSSDPAAFLKQLGGMFAQQARYHKALQHMREANQLQSKEADKQNYIAELDSDFDKEYKKLVEKLLWVEFSSTIKKYAREGSMNYYEEQY